MRGGGDDGDGGKAILESTEKRDSMLIPTISSSATEVLPRFSGHRSEEEGGKEGVNYTPRDHFPELMYLDMLFSTESFKVASLRSFQTDPLRHEEQAIRHLRIHKLPHRRCDAFRRNVATRARSRAHGELLAYQQSRLTVSRERGVASGGDASELPRSLWP